MTVVIKASPQYKDGLSKYGDPNYKDNTLARPFNLYKRNSYTAKTAVFRYSGVIMGAIAF